MDDLQGLLAQFQPTEADRKRARQQALMAASLSLLGRPKGAEYQSFGQAGLLGMGLYNNQLANIPKQRMDALKTYGALQDLINKQRMLKTSADILSDNSTPGMPSGAVGGGMGGGAAGTFGLSSQPGPVSGQPSQMPIPTWKALMPREERALLAATGDPKLILESIQKYTKTERGPDGTVMTVTGVPLYKMTDAGVQFFAPNGMPSEFTPFPQGSTDAAARRTGAIEGAKEAATQAAKFPYQLDTAIGPNGAPRRGFATDLYGSPQAGGGTTTGRTITMDFPGGMSAADQAAVQRDIDRSGYAGMGFSMPSNRVVSGPNPLDMKRAEGEIQTRNEQNNVIAKGQGEDYLNIVKAEKDATGNIAKYDLMKNYLSKVETGKLAPSVLGLKSVAAYIAPNLAKDWTKDVPYAQASAALSNEIALQLRNPQGGAGMPGALSDRDREFLVSMTANSANDPRAIPMMLDARIAMEKRAQEVGRMARQYRQRNGQLDEGFYEQLRNYSEEHPLFAGVVKDTPASSGGWSIRRIN